ncbi:MAG: AraC family transcriptional regulator [Solobacterium sp.]|jgi:AraC-like DNA-binding protein|nr:AraC family transcriptional regulator [Solobacterium sp.]MCH4048470.1 AraC family transcriptional regulator [Solobacterium sp.]MCH4074678.1 AraC family transcriptional regulator [Solobacterium sp.]MCI1408614.1 AraC family transcriptional regulator [Solobacterium sp.]MCI1436784.1 AraC family transcriptional regulator [Solobacterium sp.]
MKTVNDTNYTFGSLPVVLEQREISSAEPHQELAHWHDMLELIQVRSGQMHCCVNGSDFLLKKGDICIINEDQIHRIYSSEENPCDANTLTISPVMLQNITDMYNKLILPVISDSDFTHIRMNGRNSHARMISDLIDEMMRLAEEQPAGCELQALACVAMILRQIYLVYSEEPIAIEHDEDLRLHKKMTAYIYKHYSDHISLDDIAASAGISRSKCSILFNKYAETSPIDFLNAYRLEMAAGQLRTTSYTIASIAYACGFNQQSYFNRMFAREYSMPPKAYRLAHQNTQ